MINLSYENEKQTIKQEINITLVVVRKLLYIVVLSLLSFVSYGSVQENYKGSLIIDGNNIRFSVSLSIAKNNLITGTSLTAQGTQDETKCKIKGKYNKKDKSILFYETVVISSKAEYKNLNFCLLVANLKREETKKLVTYKGKVVGYVRGKKTICAQGGIYLERPKTTKAIKPTTKIISLKQTKTDTLLSHIAGKKIIDYKLEKGSVNLEIWDNVKADGDRVDIYLDGKKIVANYELKERKKSISLNLTGKKHIIKIVALNEGKASPNTSTISLRTKAIHKKVIAHIKKSEEVYIRLN